MASIKFCNPRKSRVVIFDRVGSDIIERAILEGIGHEVLASRYELFYITPPILLLMLKNMRHIRIFVGRNIAKSLKNLLGSIYRIYLLSCIEYMEPKVIVTFIDNSYAFHFISRRYQKGYFLAIQNAMRCAGDMREWRPPYPEPASVISMPVVCCFGAYDRDLYRKYNHQVDVFYPIGSLNAGYYKAQIASKHPDKAFDLCLISQWHNHQIMTVDFPPEIGIGLNNLDTFLNRYLQERKLTCCVALRSGEPEEEEYFKNRYGSQVHLVKSDRKEMSSYRAVDKSSVVINFQSTLAWEAFGWGAKVLFCNFSGDDLYTFPRPGFWSITEYNFELFRDRLDHIMAMGEKEYRDQTKEVANYVMSNVLDKPPQEFIKGLILDKLTTAGFKEDDTISVNHSRLENL